MKNAPPTHRDSKIDVSVARGRSPITADVTMDSATESEEEGPPIAPEHASHPAANTEHAEIRPQSENASRGASTAPGVAQSRSVTKLPPSDSESSPARPTKKAKASTSSDEDSEEERKRLVAQIRSGAAPARGARQPLRRGGKRF